MDIKHSFEKLKSVFTSDKKLAVLCAVGVLGVVLLILSEFIPSGEKKAEKKESVTAAQSQETYAEDIEKRLTEIVSSIDGAGKTRVMVTLEGGGSDAVRQEITQAITAVLDISASRVYITKMSA